MECTICKRAEFDDISKRWTVEVEREGQTFTLNPAQLVLATGMSGVPTVRYSKARIASAALRIIRASTGTARPTRARNASSLAPTIPLTISRRTCGSTALM